MSIFSISDLEHLSGIKAHTLRIWEQRYNIIRPKRTDTNIRYYDDTDLKLVLNISLLKEHGFKISEIARMTVEDMSQEVLALTDKNLRYSDQIQALTLSMIDLDEERFEKIMATNALQCGFEQTMINIVYPFLIKIGVLWQTGAISPAQEHFISNLIRQKLIVAIDGQIMRRDDCPKYMLFLPEGELHELSLLFANYLLRARQNRIIYLGQSLPFADVVSAYDIYRPHFILTVITSMPGPEEVQVYLDKLAASFPKSRILVTGYQVVAHDLQIADNVIVIRKFRDLMSFAEENGGVLCTDFN
jgi:DNA-binding transcriptional MerR regulator